MSNAFKDTFSGIYFKPIKVRHLGKAIKSLYLLLMGQSKSGMKGWKMAEKQQIDNTQVIHFDFNMRLFTGSPGPFPSQHNFILIWNIIIIDSFRQKQHFFLTSTAGLNDLRSISVDRGRNQTLWVFKRCAGDTCIKYSPQSPRAMHPSKASPLHLFI